MKTPPSDSDRFTPTPEQAAQGMVTANATRCGVCGSPADRYEHHFQCQANQSHIGDLKVGIFSDHTYPSDQNQ